MSGLKGEPAYFEAKPKAFFRRIEEKGWVWKEKIGPAGAGTPDYIEK